MAKLQDDPQEPERADTDARHAHAWAADAYDTAVRSHRRAVDDAARIHALHRSQQAERAAEQATREPAEAGAARRDAAED